MSEAAAWQAACPVCGMWGGLQHMPSRVCCPLTPPYTGGGGPPAPGDA